MFIGTFFDFAFCAAARVKKRFTVNGAVTHDIELKVPRAKSFHFNYNNFTLLGFFRFFEHLIMFFSDV